MKHLLNRSILLGLLLALASMASFKFLSFVELSVGLAITSYTSVLSGLAAAFQAKQDQAAVEGRGRLYAGTMEFVLYPSAVCIVAGLVWMRIFMPPDNTVDKVILFSMIAFFVGGTAIFLVFVSLPRISWDESGIHYRSPWAEKYIRPLEIQSINRDSNGSVKAVLSTTGERIDLSADRGGTDALVRFAEKHIDANETRSSFPRPRVSPAGQLAMGVPEYVYVGACLSFPALVVCLFVFDMVEGDAGSFYLIAALFFTCAIFYFLKYSAPRIRWSHREFSFRGLTSQKAIRVEDLQHIKYGPPHLANALVSVDGTEISFLHSKRGVAALTAFAQEQLKRNQGRAAGRA